jgi:purine-binding chemotaxis protein CheW
MANIATTGVREPVSQSDYIQAGAGQYLTFVLGGEVYALGISNIKEIIDYGNVTDVPMMPSFIRGVINLRGSVVPVVDLMTRFGKGRTQIAKRTGIVIVETGGMADNDSQDIGVIVDAVNEVIDIDRQDIEPPPSFGSGIRPDFVSGMAKRKGHFVILLNVEKVLSVDEMAELSRAADSQAAPAVAEVI